MPHGLKTKISWLHLSDFHLRASMEWSQDVVLDSLLKDIRSRYGLGNKPDLLFLTGDLSFSGKPEEFVLVEEFIKKLQATTEVSADRMFIIPGNHDIDREVEEDAFRGVHSILKDATEVDKFFSKEGRRKTLFRRQEAFRAFVNRIAPPDNEGYTPTSFAHSKSIALGPINVCVLLLDSTWLSQGGSSDIGSLLIGERQVIDAHGLSKKTALTFGLVHHPFSWLREFEQTSIENLILDRVNIVFRGHAHYRDLRATERSDRRLTIFTAGAAYETRTSDNSYGWGSIDLLTGMGESVIHKYIHSDKQWQEYPSEYWQISSKLNPRVPFKDALLIFSEAGNAYVYYGTSLLAGYSTDIPRFIDKKWVYLNHEINITGDDNLLGQIIAKLCQMFFWKDIWDQHEWSTELFCLVKQFKDIIDQLAGTSPDNFKFLCEQEKKCQQYLEAMGHLQRVKATPVIAQLEELIELRNWHTALEIINRWFSQDILNKEDKLIIKRIEIKVLLELNQGIEAIEKLRSIIEKETPDAADFYLGAVCYYKEKQYSMAGEYMHKALDLNIEINTVREMARRIAAQTGDNNLVKRVSNE